MVLLKQMPRETFTSINAGIQVLQPWIKGASFHSKPLAQLGSVLCVALALEA